MNIIAINGSPRKKFNTATILQHVLDGARQACPDIECEMVNLYEHDYKGCISCFECKRLGGKNYGKCAVHDGIADILTRSLHADCLVFGSPVYFSDVTGMMRCFWERLYFPNFVYDKDYSSLAPKKIRTAFIYTMNIPEQLMDKTGYPQRFAQMEMFAGKLFGHKPFVQYVCDTYQFNDYSKYKMEVFSETEKAKVRETQFPLDCRKAEEIGGKLASGVVA